MTIFRDLARRDDESGRFGRHALLLGSLIALLVVLPALRDVPGGNVRFSVMLVLVLIAAIYVQSVNRWIFGLGLVIGAFALAAIVTAETTGSNTARLIGTTTGLGLLGMTTLIMLNTLLHEDRVSVDTIVGGICVYLMIGLSYTLVYQVALAFAPDSLLHAGVAFAGVEDTSRTGARVLYFSFVTLTTLGFGDIVPAGEWTQMLAVSEAIIGQLYVAIFIARLMGLFIAGARSDSE